MAGYRELTIDFGSFMSSKEQLEWSGGSETLWAGAEEKTKVQSEDSEFSLGEFYHHTQHGKYGVTTGDQNKCCFVFFFKLR